MSIQISLLPRTASGIKAHATSVRLSSATPAFVSIEFRDDILAGLWKFQAPLSDAVDLSSSSRRVLPPALSNLPSSRYTRTMSTRSSCNGTSEKTACCCPNTCRPCRTFPSTGVVAQVMGPDEHTATWHEEHTFSPSQKLFTCSSKMLNLLCIMQKSTSSDGIVAIIKIWNWNNIEECQHVINLLKPCRV